MMPDPIDWINILKNELLNKTNNSSDGPSDSGGPQIPSKESMRGRRILKDAKDAAMNFFRKREAENDRRRIFRDEITPISPEEYAGDSIEERRMRAAEDQWRRITRDEITPISPEEYAGDSIEERRKRRTTSSSSSSSSSSS